LLLNFVIIYHIWVQTDRDFMFHRRKFAPRKFHRNVALNLLLLVGLLIIAQFLFFEMEKIKNILRKFRKTARFQTLMFYFHCVIIINIIVIVYRLLTV